MACTIDSTDSSVIISALNPSTNIGCPTTLQMGLGALGNGKLIFKRKFRWTFEIQFCCNSLGTTQTVAREFVKAGARPQIQIDEQEINYLNGVTWIPGKGKWQEMSVTYHDVSGNVSGLAVGASTTSILSWIATVYNFTDPVCLQMNSVPERYEGTARLTMWDGCGNPLECWILRHVWPKMVNWGELNSESSDACTIELTLRYSEVSYVNYCPGGSIVPCACAACPS